MKKLLKLLVVLLLIPTFVFAKEINLYEFTSPSTSEYFNNYGVSETLDGGYVVVSYNEENPVLTKYDKDDKVVWEKELEYYDTVYDLDIDSKGNIYVVGTDGKSRSRAMRDEHYFIERFDKDGNSLKVSYFDHEEYHESRYIFDLEVNDNNVVIVGSIYNDFDVPNRIIDGVDSDGSSAYTVLFNKDLEVVSESLIDYNNYEEFRGVTLTSDGGYVAVGFSASKNIPGGNIYAYKVVPIIAKFDKTGKLEWLTVRPLDSRLNRENSCDYDLVYDLGYLDVIEDRDGNYVTVGTVSTLSSMEMAEEQSSWEKLEEMLGSHYNDLEIDYDDPDIMYYESDAGIIAKYDKTGKLISETIDDTQFDDNYTDILELKNGGYLVSGNMGHERYRDPKLGKNYESLGWNNNTCIYGDMDVKLALYDNDLKEEWSKLYEGKGYDYLYNVSPISNSEFVFVGGFESPSVGEAKLGEDAFVSGLVIRLKITYEINAKETENGTFTAQNQDGKADVVYDGDKGIIIPTPNEGYKVNGVSVVDSKGREVPVTKTAEGTYEYEIYDDTWVTVNFAKKELVEIPKTGLDDLLMFGFISLLIGGSVYYLVGKNQVFKKM